MDSINLAILAAYVLYFGAIFAAAAIPDRTPVVVVVGLHFLLALCVAVYRGPRQAWRDRYRSGAGRAAVAVGTDILFIGAFVAAVVQDSGVWPCVVLALVGNTGCVALRTCLPPTRATVSVLV